jgi:alkaline phosphatase D
MRLNRRRLLSLIPMAASAPSLAHAAGEAQGSIAFRHGVASGDPLSGGVIIWTRATPAEATAAVVSVNWTMAEDAAFAHVVASGRAETGPAHDYTVKVDVGGLKPGRDYWYRFTAGGVTSPVGRTRTLPSGPVDKVVLAFVTCSLHPNGLFNAYDHIAQAETLDAVIELGDYIYEYGAQPQDYGMEHGRKLGRIPEPAHDLVTLADYRTRYAQYRSDPDLQAAHARAPWICVWDDHEVANDSWKGGAENHHEKTEGAFDDRKAAALRAWYEWIPVRDPVPGRAFEAINRNFDFGNLLSLTMLESRLTARSYQLEYERPGDIPLALYDVSNPKAKVRVTDPAILAKVKAESATTGAPPAPYAYGPDVEAIDAFISNPDRQMLGAAQEAWLAQTLKASVASGKPWQVIGNEVIMARARAPDIEAVVGREKVQALLATMPEAVRPLAQQFIAAMSYGQPFDLDGWDGYPAARARFDTILKSLGGGNPVVLSGDSHAFWLNELRDAKGGPALAVEFGVSSVTSPSIGDYAGFQLGDVFVAQKGEVVFCDQLAKGYVRLTLTPEAATGEMIAVPILAKPYAAKTLAAWRLKPTQGPGAPEIIKL